MQPFGQVKVTIQGLPCQWGVHQLKGVESDIVLPDHPKTTIG